MAPALLRYCNGDFGRSPFCEQRLGALPRPMLIKCTVCANFKCFFCYLEGADWLHRMRTSVGYGMGLGRHLQNEGNDPRRANR